MTNPQRKIRGKNSLRCMVEKGYKLNAAVAELVDATDLGSPHSFPFLCNISSVMVCQPTIQKMLSAKNLCD